MQTRVRNPLAKFRGNGTAWANPQESVGELTKQIDDKNHCWKAKGRAREIFEILAKDLKTYTDKCVDSIPRSNYVTWSIYMIGRTPETAAPVVMFFCEEPESRRKVQDSIKRSGILKRYPGIKSGNAPLPPDLEQLEPLASDAVSHKDTIKAECAEPDFTISVSQNKVIFKRHHGNTSSTRTATAGGIVQYNGDTYVLTAGHLFDETSPIPRNSRVNDDGWEVDSDGDGDIVTEIDTNEVEFVETTSRASTSCSGDTSSDAHSTRSSPFSNTPTSVEGRSFSQTQAVSCQVVQTRASEDTTPVMDVLRFGLNSNILPVSAATEGHLVVLSADFDYALIKLKDPSSLAVKGDKSAARPEHVIPTASRDTEIITYTASGGLMTGTLYGTPSYTRLPNSKTFQKVYTVHLNGALVKGDCGSWVIDAETRGLYGHIIAGCEGRGTAYIMSAYNVFEDAKERLGGQLLLEYDFVTEEISPINPADIAQAVSAIESLISHLHSPIFDDSTSLTVNFADKYGAQSQFSEMIWPRLYLAENYQLPQLQLGGTDREGFGHMMLTPSSHIFLKPSTFIGNHTVSLYEHKSTPSDSDFGAQHIQLEATSSWSPHSWLTDPWTPSSARHSQDYQPGPDEIILAPGSTHDTSVDGSVDFHGRDAENDQIFDGQTSDSTSDTSVDGSVEFQGRKTDNGQTFDGQTSESSVIENEDMLDELLTDGSNGPPNGNFGNLPCEPERPRHNKNLGRRGKLDEKTAQSAEMIRKIRPCWSCRLLRYKCDSNDICLSCRKSRYRSLFYFGCIRADLSEFTSTFLPDSLMAQYDPANLRQFVKRHIRHWTRNAMDVKVTWGYGRSITCEVLEFEPKGDFLSLQSQYQWSMMTNKYETVRVPSLPIGIVLMEPTDWREQFQSYLDQEVEENFAGFPERCFRGEEFEVQKDILYALHDHHVSLKRKVIELGPQWQSVKSSLVTSCKALKLCLKLLMITHIMTRTLTLTESSKQQVYDQLIHRPTEVFGVHASSRILNKELKFIIAPIYRQYWTTVLDQIDNILLNNHRGKPSSWATVLGLLSTLTMTMETVQIGVRCQEETDKCDKIISENSNFATLTLERMEEKWELLLSLFHGVYRFNPIQKAEDRKKLDTLSQVFAQNIYKIIEKHHEFLESRRPLKPPLSPQDPNNSRLIAKFLLSLKLDAVST